MVLKGCIALGFLLCLCPSGKSKAESVTLSTWPSYGKNAGYYLAMQRGFYKERGVQLRILNSFQNTLIALESGEAQVAQVLCAGALKAIDTGAHLRIIAARDANFPVGTISLMRRGINSPADYANRIWGHSAGFSPETALLPMIAKTAGLDARSVKIVHVEFSARLPALIRGDVDFVSAWWGSGYPPQLLAAKAQGIELKFIRWSEYGIDIYGECLVSRVDYLERHAATMQKFLAATVLGFEAALTDSDGAIDATLAQIPENSRDRALIHLSWTQSKDLLYDVHSTKVGLFAISEEKMARTASFIFGLKTDRKAQHYSNEYLPKRDR